jgi:hypothetical protein
MAAISLSSLLNSRIYSAKCGRLSRDALPHNHRYRE